MEMEWSGNGNGIGNGMEWNGIPCVFWHVLYLPVAAG